MKPRHVTLLTLAIAGAIASVSTKARADDPPRTEPPVQWFDANGAATSPKPPSGDAPPNAPERKPSFVSFQLAGTGTARTFLDIPFMLAGGEGGIVLTPRSGVLSVDVAAHYSRGASPNGLGMGMARLTGTAYGNFGRFHLGGGWGIGHLSIARNSRDGTISRLGVNLHVQASVDVVQFEGVAFFIRPRGELDHFWGGTTAWSGAASIGARF